MPNAFPENKKVKGRLGRNTVFDKEKATLSPLPDTRETTADK